MFVGAAVGTGGEPSVPGIGAEGEVLGKPEPEEFRSPRVLEKTGDARSAADVHDTESSQQCLRMRPRGLLVRPDGGVRLSRKWCRGPQAAGSSADPQPTCAESTQGYVHPSYQRPRRVGPTLRPR